MSFISDKQTLEDLNVTGRYKNNSIRRLFDHTVTDGGSRLMDEWFKQPLTDSASINARTAVFGYFTGHEINFPFSAEAFAIMENYLRSGSEAGIFPVVMHIASKKILQVVAGDKDYGILATEVLHTIGLLNQLSAFSLRFETGGHPYAHELAKIRDVFDNPRLSWLKNSRMDKSLSFFELIRYDHLLRGEMKEEIHELMNLIYRLDVYLAVAAVARRRRFSYAHALPPGKGRFFAEALCHPALENALGNSVSLDDQQNVLFLTGANMAGKSTLMKAIGISFYLAHMGFPVAAERMEFSVMDGIYTSINVPDSLEQGYSHFYAEVLRVKKVAEEVAAGRNIIAIFDELFKGTNVKDAYDATLSITEAFSAAGECFFVISTHIIEVGESLAQRCSNFRFAYLPAILEGNKPRYTYRLLEGITSDRQGMTIIENEKILEILRSASV